MSKTQSKSTAKNLVAGGTAGAIEACIMYPTEYTKTLVQLALRDQSQGKKVPYTGAIGCARWTIANKGVLGLYKGLSTLVIGSIPKAAVRFAAFNFWKQRLVDENGELSTARTMLAGLGVGVLEAIIAVTPMETAKTRLVDMQRRGVSGGLPSLIKSEGIGALYKGLVPTMMKQGTNQMVRFSIYGRIKKAVAPADGDIGLFRSLAAGSLAGFVSVYVTMPFDVVKTKMQSLEAKAYKNTLDCFLKTVQNDGVLALWKGTTPRLSRVCFSGGIIFAAYEQVMKGLNTFWAEPEE